MDGILITERPTGISWQQISDLLKEAHAENDRQGIVSRYPHLPPDQLQQQVEGHGGKLFVAQHNPCGLGAGAGKEACQEDEKEFTHRTKIA